MPIISHAVLLDNPIEHRAVVEYRPPCVVETLNAPSGLNWSWSVAFGDNNQDGRADLLVVGTSHRVAPHAGEPVPNVMRRIIYPRPCSIVQASRILVPDPHGHHEDRVFTDVRRISWPWLGRRRLSIVMKHCGPDVTIDFPDGSLEPGGGVLER